MPSSRHSQAAEVPGLAARRVAADLLDGVLRRRRPLDEQLDTGPANASFLALADRDRALVRRIVATALRRLGTLRTLIGQFLERGVPADAPRVETILLTGAAQILWLDVPDHAAVDLAVRIAQLDRRAGRYTGLVNAVLRRVAREARARLVELDGVALDTPAWLLARWRAAYGDAIADTIARANGEEPALDLTVRSDSESWAARLRGRALPTGTVRIIAHGPVTLLPGYAEGAWWVQDAAAALPARLFGDLSGQAIADLCAAPGGKTAQLALAGANVTAVDRSAARLSRLRENLRRLHLDAVLVNADATEWSGGTFDAVLLDAPCSSTGTIRRHPDIPWLKQEADLAGLLALQRRLLDQAATLLKPGGTLVYCICSLEPEEGIDQIEGLLTREKRLRRRPIEPDEIAGTTEFVTPGGDLRTLPLHWPTDEPRMGGLDGFFAARLQCTA
ncbi:MAG: methyltransferase domain-containing protein [Rhizobiales bacterium]|nr:methyltransferase domain-containing protein [Hyphomicrobiales bacterium]